MQIRVNCVINENWRFSWLGFGLEFRRLREIGSVPMRFGVVVSNLGLCFEKNLQTSIFINDNTMTMLFNIIRAPPKGLKNR